MGCCCFNTLRGAAFFVASIHIYNGLECMLKFIAFPIVFTAMHNKGESETPFVAFLPGMGYAIVYFILGCAIFRSIEKESIAGIKWCAVGFAIVEVVFFCCRTILRIVPTPTIPDIPKQDQPFEWNIYKTLNYFLFTIVGGLVYICVLFLYFQKLSTGQDEEMRFAHFFNLRPSTTPTEPVPPATPAVSAPPATTNLPPDNSSSAAAQILSNSSQQQQQPITPPSSQQLMSSNNNKPSSKSHHHSHHHRHKSEISSDRGSRSSGCPKPRLASTGGMIDTQQAGLPHGGQPLSSKDPCSPGSPMFPYFLLRRNSKSNGSQKSGGGHMEHRGVVEEGPPPPTVSSWHPHPSRVGVQSVSMLNRGVEYGDVPPTPPRSDGGGVPCGPPSVGRNLLSPSRLVNHHQQPQMPPPHQFPPIIPPFYPDSADEGQGGGRRESFVPQGFVSPTGSHYGTGGGGYRGAESLYQKIPMSPGFDYCLR